MPQQQIPTTSDPTGADVVIWLSGGEYRTTLAALLAKFAASLTEKNPAAEADLFLLFDSAAGDAPKDITLAHLRSSLLSPANVTVVISPTGSGAVTINPATAGTIDNVAIGSTTPKTGVFDTTLRLQGTSPAVTVKDTAHSGNAAIAYVEFRDSANARMGFVGDGQSGNQDIILASDNANLRLIPVSGGSVTAFGQLIGGGTATNDSAAAGNIGEIITSNVASGSAVALTTATPANVTSISLTAGDWDVSGEIIFSSAATTSITVTVASISITSATLAVPPNGPFTVLRQAAFVPTLSTSAEALPLQSFRFSLASTTTVYLVASATFTVSTLSAYGYIQARRMR